MLTELRLARDLEQFLERSKQEPVFVFKHSTQCSRSAAAHEQLEEFVETHAEIPCAVVDVLADRDVSDAIEDRFGIRHESPQAILFVDGTPVWHAAHWKVTTDAMIAALNNLN